MSPTRIRSWSEVGKPTLLREHFSRTSQTGLGLITMTATQGRCIPVGASAPYNNPLPLVAGPNERNNVKRSIVAEGNCDPTACWRFTIFEGAINTEDVIFFLTMVHEYYGGKVMIIWDSLSSHLSARKHFESVHPDWFVFEQLPPYSPELNPVEQCWQMMKNVYMANFVPKDVEQLEEKTCESAQRINSDPKLLASFFHHAKLAL